MVGLRPESPALIDALATEEITRADASRAEVAVLTEDCSRSFLYGGGVDGRLGSLTKVLTGVAALRAATEGAVALDLPVATTVPGGRLWDDAATREVDLEQLLSHTSGCGEWTVQRVPAHAHDLERSIAALEAIARPGERYSYSHAGFAIAGSSLSSATGFTFVEAVEHYVTRPLGLDSTSECIAPGDPMTPALGYRSTTGDLVELARFIMDAARDEAGGDIGRLFRPVAPSIGSFQTCLAMYERELSGVPVFQHGGAGPGFGAILVMVPSERLAIVVLDEVGGLMRLRLADRILRAVLGARDECESDSPATGEHIVGSFADRGRLIGLSRSGVEGRLRVVERRPNGASERWAHRHIRFLSRDEFVDDGAIALGPSWPYRHQLVRDAANEIVGVHLDERFTPVRRARDRSTRICWRSVDDEG